MARRILIAEDDPAAGGALRALVGAQLELDLVPSVAHAVAIFTERGPDAWMAAIVDVGLADGSGLDLVRALRAVRPDLPILVLTGQEERSLANRAQALGAVFAFKPVGAANLETFLSSARLSDPEERLDAVLRAFVREAGISPREEQILRLAIAGHSRDGIMLILEVNENTFKTQVRSLLSKTGTTSLETLSRAVLERVAGLSRAP